MFIVFKINFRKVSGCRVKDTRHSAGPLVGHFKETLKMFSKAKKGKK